MPSPFPGMDPYLESPAIWPDFHGRMIITIADTLNELLPARYAAGIELSIWAHEPDSEERILLGRPDIHVAEQHPPGREARAVAAAPMRLVLPPVHRREARYVEIVEPQTQRVVTVLELLSPSNKAIGPGRDAYLAKRDEYRAREINLVEIDLLRGGNRLPLGDTQPATDYYALVCRASEPEAEFWPVGVRQSLPLISVPLDRHEPDVMLDLQAGFGRVYDRARYPTRLNYGGDPVPPLREPDATWARELLAGR